MNTRTLIENWLSQSSLAAGGLRALDADGFWAVPYGSITLTLAVPEEEAFFVLYAPLMSVSGGGAQVLARFYRHLLIWQLEGDLPTGMAFGMDYDGTLVSVVGQYRTQGLDATGFDALLREATAGAEELRPRLEALFVELLAEEKSSGPESQAQAGAVLEDSSLSDHAAARPPAAGQALLERSALKKAFAPTTARAAPAPSASGKTAFFREAKAAYGLKHGVFQSKMF